MKKDERLHVVLTVRERQALRAMSAELDMSMSALSRLAIRALLRDGVTIPGFTLPVRK